MSVGPSKHHKHAKNPPKMRNFEPRPTTAQGMETAFSQTIMVPSYFYPGCADWSEMIKGMLFVRSES